MVTGFFYSDVVERNAEKRQIVKILKLILFSNLLYFAWNLLLGIAMYIFSGDIHSFADMANKLNYPINVFSMFSGNHMFKILLCNVSPFSEHLWYLNAILYVLVIAYLIRKTGMFKILYYITPTLLCADLIFGKYSVAIFGKSFDIVCVRNFLCVGIPYFMLGNVIRNVHNKKCFACKKSLLILCTGICVVLCIAERQIIVSLGINSTRDHYISTTFLACMLFILFLNSFKSVSEENIFAVIGRKYSSLIYIFHEIIMFVLRIAARVLSIEKIYAYIAPVAVFAVTAVISALYCKLINIRKTK